MNSNTYDPLPCPLPPGEGSPLLALLIAASSLSWTCANSPESLSHMVFRFKATAFPPIPRAIEDATSDA